MRNQITHFTSFLLLCTLALIGNAQTHTLRLTIENQPETKIYLGWIKGDDFFKIDSTKAINGHAEFQISNTTHTGVFRIILGKTPYARVMNEAPQQLDIIFNKENITLETDFKNPQEKLVVVNSAENKLWYDFIAKQKRYKQKFSILEKELNNCWNTNDTTLALTIANDFNQLQMEYDLRLSQTVQQNSNLFAAEIMAISRQPISDGFLSAKERNEQLKAEFLENTNFSNEQLIYSSAYSNKVFEYLMLFNKQSFTHKQRMEAYIPAVDNIMFHIQENEEVKDFISSYLIHGFEVLKMQELINQIEANN